MIFKEDMNWNEIYGIPKTPAGDYTVGGEWRGNWYTFKQRWSPEDRGYV